jgi:chromosome partitioning protein
MEIWALANQKGGTGKTTTAIHLSAALAAQGKRSLLIDLDPQAHATLGLGMAVEDGRSIAAAFLDGVPLSRLLRTSGAGFHVIPSEGRLAEFEEVAERSLQPEGILALALEELAPRYDWVVLDCPPRADGVITANAVRAATTTLLVVETGAFAMQGALKARSIFEERARERGRRGELRLMATMVDREKRISREFLVALQARFGPIMLDTVVRRDEVLREAVACGVPAPQLDEESDAAQDFDALAAEILALTASPDGTLAPSGARATDPESTGAQGSAALSTLRD